MNKSITNVKNGLIEALVKLYKAKGYARILKSNGDLKTLEELEKNIIETLKKADTAEKTDQLLYYFDDLRLIEADLEFQFENKYHIELSKKFRDSRISYYKPSKTPEIKKFVEQFLNKL
mgnify:CR=1 FL=1